MEAAPTPAPALLATVSITGWEEEPKVLAAHCDGKDFTQEEWQEIEDFVRFVKSRRKQ